MESFDKQKYILKLLKNEIKGSSIENIIDFLDYINKVKYNTDEIEDILQDLITEKKIYYRNNLYFNSNT